MRYRVKPRSVVQHGSECVATIVQELPPTNPPTEFNVSVPWIDDEGKAKSAEEVAEDLQRAIRHHYARQFPAEMPKVELPEAIDIE